MRKIKLPKAYFDDEIEKEIYTNAVESYKNSISGKKIKKSGLESMVHQYAIHRLDVYKRGKSGRYRNDK